MATYYVATDGDDVTGDGSIGNPFATPGKGASVLATDDICYVKKGTYVLSTNTPGPGGPVSITVSAEMHGYNEVPDDIISVNDPNMPVLDAGIIEDVNLCYLSVGVVGRPYATGFHLRGNGNLTVRGLATGSGQFRSRAGLCRVLDCPSGNSMGAFHDCIFENCGSLVVMNSLTDSAVFYGSGMHSTSNADVANCLFANCSGRACQTRTNIVCNSIFYGSSSDGMYLNLQGLRCSDCMFIENGGFGIEDLTVSRGKDSVFERCVFYGNISGPFSSLIPTNRMRSAIYLTSNPFIDPANLNFNLNNEPGGGAVLRAVGLDFGATQLRSFYPWVNEEFGAGVGKRNVPVYGARLWRR